MRKAISFDTVKDLNLDAAGLPSNVALDQLERYGPNSVSDTTSNFALDLAREAIKDPMLWFLLGIGAVFWVVGDETEAIVLLLATIPVFAMDLFLHWRTQSATESLKSNMATKALVIRDGLERMIDSNQIVPGDLVLVDSNENAFIPADGYWESTDRLQVDESTLTGEAFPIKKQMFSDFKSCVDTGIAVNSDFLGFAGTRALTGAGRLRALATGRHTEYGEIMWSVSAIGHERTALQKNVAKLTETLLYIAGAACLILAIVRYIQGYGWLDSLLSAATLAVAAFPEEFPVVLSFFLGVGVYRLAQNKALVRRAVTVENIGRVSCICTDKTGTITFGQLSLAHFDPAKGVTDSELLNFAFTASDPAGNDPLDEAIVSAAQQRKIESDLRYSTIPFAEDRKRHTVFTRLGSDFYCITKGAPETVLRLCRLSQPERDDWTHRVSNWAKQGHKVIGVAKRQMAHLEWSQSLEPTSGMEWLGLLAFEDPARPDVAPAIEFCQKNGIRVLMLTGDHPDTATAIARDIGLGGGSPRVISAENHNLFSDGSSLIESTCSEPANPTSNELESADVLARCTPLQKLQIVQLFKSRGEVVAVTGDGVNDVPALKAADIGFAMGLRGSRSAREVASIVLADDRFSTIVSAIREGRQLSINLRNSFEYLLLFHFPFVVSAALIPLMGYRLLFQPIHIVWLELLIHPTALLAFQATAKKDSIESVLSPASLFSYQEAKRLLLVGVVLTAAMVAIYVYFGVSIDNEAHGRSMVMAALGFWSAALAISLTKGRSRTAVYIALATVGVTFILINGSVLGIFQSQLHVEPLNALDWLIVVSVVLATTGLNALMRRLTLVSKLAS